MGDQAAGGLFSPFLARRRLAVATPWLRGRVLDVGCGSGVVAHIVGPDRYVGVDRDVLALSTARLLHPQHSFLESIPDGQRFDTICMLAVIEHMSNPADTLRSLAPLLQSAGCFVLTTPSPSIRWFHEIGAKFGLFSSEAAEEHERLLDRRALHATIAASGLRILSYRRFMLGANQLVIAHHGE